MIALITLIPDAGTRRIDVRARITPEVARSFADACEHHARIEEERGDHIGWAYLIQLAGILRDAARAACEYDRTGQP